MIRRFFLMLVFLAPLSAAAASSVEEAKGILRAAVDEVLAQADKAPSLPALEQSLSPLLRRHISFEAMTRRSIGPGWRQFSEAQQKKAVELLSKLIIRSYSSKLTIGERAEIRFDSASATAAGRVEVATTTLYKGNRYAVIYRLEQAESWRTTDVVIEGVSMVANYRSQLDPIFKKGGPEAVIRSLEQSAARPR